MPAILRQLPPGSRSRQDIGGQRQHRFKQTYVADREWVVWTPTASASRAGVTIVASQRALTTLVELARGVQRKRMRRDDEP